jgi:hypothetical protein
MKIKFTLIKPAISVKLLIADTVSASSPDPGVLA